MSDELLHTASDQSRVILQLLERFRMLQQCEDAVAVGHPFQTAT
jgi:hypothetical protein